MRYNYDGYGYGPLEATSHRVTTVATPLVTLDELKQHLGIFETDFDTQLQQMILPAATQIVDNIMGEYGNDTIVAAYYRTFSNRIVLPHTYVDSVSSVQYYNESHTLTNLVAGTDYVFDDTAQPPQVVFLTDAPALSDRFADPVVVNYIAFIDSTRYNQEAIVQATLLVAAELWYNRTNTIDGGRGRAAVTAERILAPLKRISI